MIPKFHQGKKAACIFLCPLDWGLGHATRLMPVIRQYLDAGNTVIIGGSGNSGELLKESFPTLKFLHVPSHKITYPVKSSRLIPSLLLQLPSMIYSAFMEHRFLKNILKYQHIDTVVSDNRYGLYSRYTYNIFITHQVSPVLPVWLKWAEYPVYLLMRFMIGHFNECWIPDYSGEENLSGILSHRFKLPSQARYIGLLSRFSPGSNSSANEIHYDIVIVLSGPQPQLHFFTKQIIDQVSDLPFRVLIIAGRQSNFPLDNTNVKMVSHLPPEEFKNALTAAGMIVCRAGYSGIMDLVILGKSAILVPTPGQPEQEYLAGRLHKKGLFRYVKQSDLNIQKLATDYFKINTTTITEKPSRKPE